VGVKLSRRLTIFVFWLFGFGIGFVAYLSLPSVAQWLTGAMPNFMNQAVIGALITGIVGSVVTTFTVIIWANKTT
jgi:uncharacterized membrane protein YeaQ/YmgE (transglycosylase-associated protein family)